MDYATNEQTGLPVVSGMGAEQRGADSVPSGLDEAGSGVHLPLPFARRHSACAGDSATAEAVSLLQGIVRDVPGLFAITAHGHSMLDALVSDGDVVMLQHSAGLRDGEQVAVRVCGGQLKLRRAFRDGDHVRLQPNNQRMPAERVASNKVEVVGRVVAIVRQDPRTREAAGQGSAESPTRAA